MALNSAGDSARISGLKAKERRPLRFEPRVGALSLTLMLASGIVGPLRFVLNKIAVEGGVPPFAFAFWPMLFAGILLLIVAFLRGDRPSLKFSHLRAYLSVGIFALGAPMAVLTFLADRLPQGLISMVVILAPTMTYLFAILLRVDRLRLLSSAGMAVGLGGILLIVLPDVSLPERAMVWWLLLALLALWPIRRRSLAALTVSRHVERHGERIVLLLHPEDTKAKRAESFEVPDVLLPHVARYLDRVRPTLLGIENSDAFWISACGNAMCAGQLFQRVYKKTAEAFGHAMGLHDFRRAAATYIAMDAPDLIGIVPGTLQHLSPDVSEQHYNLARTTQASRRHGAHLASLRDDLRGAWRRQQ